MTKLKTILITGANRGIGLELVKQTMEQGFHVFATFRNKNKSEALLSIASNNLEVFEMNVVNERSILEASNKIKLPLDYLVCNAGINNGFGSLFDEDHSHEKMLEVLNINVLGCILTVRHFSKVLNNNAKIILMSSILGIQDHQGSNAMIYRASKAAVNNIMVSLAEEFKSKNIIVSSFHPGWVRTDMGGLNATLSAKESVSFLMKSFQYLNKESSGKFINFDGNFLNF